MMRHIKTGMLLCLICFGFYTTSAGQVSGEAGTTLPGRDSLVNVAYRQIEYRDLNNAVSVFNPSDYIDKGYATYSFQNAYAYIGGSNLWRIGTPLILVDGVPRYADEITSIEIEQITYLKGANAVVLYGNRAANGVISITTKRGKIGDRQINVRANTGIAVPISFPEYLGSAEYMTYYNQALRNDGMEIRYSAEDIYNHASGINPYRYPNVDYYSSDYLNKVYNTYSANAEFTSGTERAQFYANAGILGENSLLNFGEGKNEGATRFNVRGNVDLKMNDFIKSYTNVSAVFYDLRYANGNYWNQASIIQPHRISPLIPIGMIDPGSGAVSVANGSNHIIDGKYILGGSQEYLTNPIGDVYAAGYSKYTSRQLQFSTGLNIDLSMLTEGLSAHGQFSVDYSNFYTESVNRGYAVYQPTWANHTNENSIVALNKLNKDSNDGRKNLGGTWNNQYIDFNFHVDYVKSISGSHNVSAMVLMAALRGLQTGDFQYRTNTNLGIQLGYNYEHKYYVDFSGALINSTRLPKNNRVAFSPTASLGWVLSEEDFLKGSSVVNVLKLTAGAGIINTDLDLVNIENQSGYYLYDPVYKSTAYFGWRDGGYVNQATGINQGPNPKLKYAKRKEINFGAEALMLDGSLGIRTSAFMIKKDDIPIQMRSIYPSYFLSYYPETSFYPYMNYEENRYTGFDFQADYKTKINNVGIEIGVTGTYVTTEALKRDELYADEYQNRKGKPLDAIFGLKNSGFFMEQGQIDQNAIQKFGEVRPGDIRYIDQNNDGIIDGRDEVMIGKWNAPFTFGMHLSATWKNFTLFAILDGQLGGTGVKTSEYYWVYGDRKYSALVRESWTEENKNSAKYPRLSTLDGDNNFRYSDFWTYSTNQLNIAQLQLTYSLPKKLFVNAGIKGLNVYVAGHNLAKIAGNRKVMELNVGSTPQTRGYTIGVKAQF